MTDKQPEALRLAQPEQEPVAWITEWKGVHSSGKVLDFKKHRRGGEVTHRPLYTTPQPRQWQGLTDEEIADIYIKWDATPGVSMADFARAIEAKLKEKNHG